MVHREIEGVEHPVFALVDRPERCAVIGDEKFGRAVVAAYRVGELELLGRAEFRAGKPRVRLNGQRLLLVPVRERVGGDFLDRAEILRVKILCRQPAGDHPLAMEADRELKALLFPCGDDRHQRADPAEPERQVFREIRLEDSVESEAHSREDSGRRAGNRRHRALADAGKLSPRNIIEPARVIKRIRAFIPEEDFAGLPAARVVHRDFRNDRRHQGVHQFGPAGGPRIGHRLRRGINRERQVTRRPCVAADPEYPRDFFRIKRRDHPLLERGVGGHVVAFCGIRAARKKWERLVAVARALFEADEDALVRRSAKLEPEPTFGPRKPEGE